MPLEKLRDTKLETKSNEPDAGCGRKSFKVVRIEGFYIDDHGEKATCGY